MIKALIFDMDGVLVDSMSYHTTAMQTIFNELGLAMEKKHIYEREGSKTYDIVLDLLKMEGIDPETFDVQGLIERYRKEFNRILIPEAFREIAEVLPLLKDDFSLAVVSGADRVIVEDMMQALFDGIFDVIISGEDVTDGKPSPEPFLKAVQMLGLSKEECIIVENAPMGVEAARRSKIFCIGIPTYIADEQLSGADLVVKDHSALKEVLLELHRSGGRLPYMVSKALL